MLHSEEKFNNYYSYINDKWFKTFNLPDEYSRISTFDLISNKIEKQIIQKKKKN